ncbi:MAG TPA: CDP-alcohol phosphatidyltransferase family protein [Steroidobacteraceae bacterium]|nr:CDP-alcohol phosphatidyltransferase family protein [Steroidobacteraceae bacterium]
MRWLPNALCVLRMLLALPVAWFLYHERYDVTFFVFFVAAVTDGLDGYIAKRFNWTTELGKILDPLADKLLLVTVFITLTIIGKVAPWLVTLVVLRDVIIAVGATIYRSMAGSLADSSPTWISKVNTVMQISYVLAAIAASSVSWPSAEAISVLGYITAGTTVISGADYIITYSKRAAALHRQVATPDS